MNIKEKIKAIKKNTTALFLAMKRKETPWYAKIAAGITVGYALSPIDLIPDFIPVLGYLDDLIILPIMIIITMKLIPDIIMEQCKVEAQGVWQNGKPKKWYYGIPIIIIWVLIILLIINTVSNQLNMKGYLI